MKRVLVVTEFTQLKTGYATVGKELLERLGKIYDVAELGLYCDPVDHQQLIQLIPWKVYPNLPNKHNSEEVKIYNSDQFNVFGKWKFEHIVNDYRPHAIISFGDYWMNSYINESPLRPYFNFVWMVPCDSLPQHAEWIDNFAQCNGVTTYTDWSKKVLESHGIKVFGTTSPAADDLFKPLNKTAIKKNYGLEDKIVIGTVMRNQKRKLFPDLFEAFRKFLDKTKRNDIVLYCHTSYPDDGWDLPKLLIEYGLTSKVLFTYICKNCGLFFPSFYSDMITQCLQCKQLTARMPNVANGVTTEALCVINNMFDLYIQPCLIEGQGRPIIEAAYCNIPIAATNFSATEDITDKLNGYKIEILRTTLEKETGRLIPTLSIDSIVDILTEFCDLPESIRLKKGYDTGKLAREHYNWDKTITIWKSYIDQIDEKFYDNAWTSPAKIYQPKFKLDQQLSNTQFVKWAIINILGDPSKIGTYLESKLLKQLNLGVISQQFLAGFSDDLSMFSKPIIQEFTRDHLVNYLIQIIQKRNYWEQVRCQNHKI